MKKLRLLLRLNRLEMLGINKMLNDPARRRRGKWLAALLALGALAAAGLAFLYCLGIAYGMRMIGALDAFPVLMVSVAALTVFITTIFKAPDALFRTRDLDMLLSLPLSTRTVAVARVLKLYGMNLLFTLLILVPAGAAYAWLARPAAWFYPGYVLTLLAAPMLPVVLASLLGVLVAFAGASLKRLRYAGLALMFVALLGVVAGSMYLSASSMSVSVLANLARGLTGALSRVYPLAGLYMSAVVLGSAGALTAFLAISLAAIALAAAVFGAVFLRLNSFLSAHGRKKRFALGARKQRGVRAALLRREWRRYLSINSYVLNTAFGLILSLVAAIALAALVPAETVNMLLAGTNMGDLPLALLSFALAWLIGMAPTTACAVSLEGKSLWIVKSLPVPARAWLLPKLRLNLQLFVPFALADALVVAWAFEARGLGLALVIAMPLLMGVFSALLGLAFNCRFPRFDWTSEAKVVKQSAGVLAPVLISMVFCFGGMALAFKVGALGHLLVPLVFSALLLLGCLGLWLRIRARAEQWARAMQG